MREIYEKQVELLLDVLPFITRRKVFALKGGTAINFFYCNCPRLSIDIDLHYIPVNGRTEALQDIATNMHEIGISIDRAYPTARITINPDSFNALVVRDGAQIKIEPNGVIRGCFPLSSSICWYGN
ncbi:MAG: hypothetical protein ACI8P9_002633 [Parasphingorhabdus sp.]|jgi:hypothetical protein